MFYKGGALIIAFTGGVGRVNDQTSDRTKIRTANFQMQ